MFLIIGLLILVAGLGTYYYGFVEGERKPKVIGIYLGITAIALIIIHFNTAAGERDIKTFTSNTGGGLVRTVEVYDQSGKLIKTYKGKIDVQDTEYGNKVLFDLNGKRTVIYNGTVIVQEN